MSNSVSRSYPKDNSNTSLREETLCPCPPETSPLDEVGGGILARHMLLSETVSGGLSINGEFSPFDLDFLFESVPFVKCCLCGSDIANNDDSDICYDCDYSDGDGCQSVVINGSAVPLNLE